jgi:primosomal protein N'
MVGYPPFTAIARVEIRHKDHAKCGALSTEAAAFLRHQAHGEVKVLGPSPAFIPRIESFYRHQILLKSPTRSRLKSLLQAFLESPAASRHARAIDVEVDPVSLL